MGLHRNELEYLEKELGTLGSFYGIMPAAEFVAEYNALTQKIAEVYLEHREDLPFVG